MHQWFLSYNGQQVGPLDHAAAVAQAAKNPNGHCWRQGFAEWIPIAKCDELAQSASHAMTAPPPPAAGLARHADEIDYKIFGSDMQFVEIELDPGESAIAEAGSLMYKQPVVKMETVFGDGSAAFTKALGLELDLTAKGMGVRCQRFSLLVDNGVVKQVNVEGVGPANCSFAENMLAQLG